MQRISEAIRLRVQDIYYKMKTLIVRSGKGNKDRVTTFPASIIPFLQAHPDKVKHRLHASALDLSGGQKQRLCLARALVLEPEILLCDEPTSSLDAHAANVIEELLVHLKTRCTILMVSHNPDQVQRIADNVFELQNGRMNPSDTPSKHLPGYTKPPLQLQ